MEILHHLLPGSASLQLRSWLLDEAKTHIKLSVSSTQPVVHCPICDHSTHRIHSHYERTLADLPWADYSITLELQVRKFFCINAGVRCTYLNLPTRVLDHLLVSRAGGLDGWASLSRFLPGV